MTFLSTDAAFSQIESFQGPVLRYPLRILWKNDLTIGWARRFFKTPLHSLFYEAAEVMSPGTVEYWECKRKQTPSLAQP